MKTLYHQELKGGYTMGRKITIDAAEIFPEEFEVMALSGDDELDCITVHNEEECKQIFDNLLLKYLEPFQKAVVTARLVSGNKYTMLYINEFGFPVAQKITFDSYQLTTYTQHSDCVKLIFTPYRKRTRYSKTFYNCSLAIFEGWQDLKESDLYDTISETDKVKVRRSKYSCFDANYIEDGINTLKDAVMVYKNYKAGVNGKIYA